MPYRVDLRGVAGGTAERLIELGALDIDVSADAVAALMPDGVAPERVTAAAGGATISISPARGLDDGSVWLLRRRRVQIAGFTIAPPDAASPGDIVLADGPAFGSGLHPTTAVCLEALEDLLADAAPARVLDVGTGSGILALAALRRGVPLAAGLDVDPHALAVAARNARLNAVTDRLHLIRGGPESVLGGWPLVFANLQAAPLIEMSPALVRCIGHGGQLLLSGIAAGLADDVARAYRRLGMRHRTSKSSGGWIALVLEPSW